MKRLQYLFKRKNLRITIWISSTKCNYWRRILCLGDKSNLRGEAFSSRAYYHLNAKLFFRRPSNHYFRHYILFAVT